MKNQMDKMLFELKPCNECLHTCVEGQINIKCPFDEMVGIPQVEKQYKNEVKTTKGEVFWLDMKVEKQYQEIQTTDDQSHFYFEKDVEKLYEQETNG